MQSIKARAKINLALNVIGRKGGMHLLDGLYATCRFGDEIALTRRADTAISVRYEGRDDLYENDTTLLAAKKLQERYGTSGVDIVVRKNIPEMRGLGGSSADAAAVAVAFSGEFGLDRIESRLLAGIGSDVPFQYEGGFARVSGRGEEVTRLTMPKLYVAVLCPPRGVSTKECFSLYDSVGGENGDVEELIRALRRKEKPIFFNALERAATMLVEEIGEGKKILKDAGFCCGMTGSGSAVFGVEYEEREFLEKLKKVIVPRGYTLTETVTEAIL